jgi:hypothetical protein
VKASSLYGEGSLLHVFLMTDILFLFILVFYFLFDVEYITRCVHGFHLVVSLMCLTIISCIEFHQNH